MGVAVCLVMLRISRWVHIAQAKGMIKLIAITAAALAVVDIFKLSDGDDGTSNRRICKMQLWVLNLTGRALLNYNRESSIKI